MREDKKKLRECINLKNLLERCSICAVLCRAVVGDPPGDLAVIVDIGDKFLFVDEFE